MVGADKDSRLRAALLHCIEIRQGRPLQDGKNHHGFQKKNSGARADLSRSVEFRRVQNCLVLLDARAHVAPSLHQSASTPQDPRGGYKSGPRGDGSIFILSSSRLRMSSPWTTSSVVRQKTPCCFRPVLSLSIERGGDLLSLARLCDSTLWTALDRLALDTTALPSKMLSGADAARGLKTLSAVPSGADAAHDTAQQICSLSSPSHSDEDAMGGAMVAAPTDGKYAMN